MADTERPDPAAQTANSVDEQALENEKSGEPQRAATGEQSEESSAFSGLDGVDPEVRQEIIDEVTRETMARSASIV